MMNTHQSGRHGWLRATAIIRSALTPLALVAVITFAGSSLPAAASHDQWEHCGNDLHWGPNYYAMQYPDNLFYPGLFGWFYTYQPSVPNINTQFSVNHLYPFTNSGLTFMEVGWYKGAGGPPAPINSSVARFYTAHADNGRNDYYEHDSTTVAPDATYVEYETQYDHFDYSTNKWVWGLYAGNLSTPLDWYETAILSNAIPESGGEANDIGVEMHATLVPNHQIKKGTSWYEWTESFMASEGATAVHTCNDLGIYWTYTTKFDNYSLSGTVQGH